MLKTPTVINPDYDLAAANRERQEARTKKVGKRKRAQAQARYHAALQNPKSNLNVIELKRGDSSVPIADQGGKILELKQEINRLNAIIKNLISRNGNGFYSTDAWRNVRYKALTQANGKCACCGAAQSDGAQLHVDHIKPRSLYPSLELALSNLQVLCRDCNLGKSNRDQIDWRKADSGT